MAHLAELETRGLHLAAGYGSLFAYCCEVLRLSEHEAYHRIEAARAARRFPVILALLAEGAINLTTVRLLGRHLTADNHVQVLESARGLRKAQVEDVAARLAPAPDRPVSVRKLPTPTASVVVRAVSLLVAEPGPSAAPPPVADAPVADAVAATATEEAAASIRVADARTIAPLTAPPVAPSIATVSALSPDRYRIQMTLGGDTLEKLRLAKDLLRHAIPTGDDAAILDRALTVLLDDLLKKKFAATERPRPSPDAAPGSRHIPAAVRRAVFLRDRGRCAFAGTAGRRCGERAFLEFHHVRPHAEGGPATIENIELRCRRHNGCEWRRRSLDVRWLEEQRYAARSGVTFAPRPTSPDGGHQGTLEATRPRPSP